MDERDALEVLYGGWAAYQEQLVAAAAPLTDEQLGLRAAPGLRSVGEQLAHIAGVRAGWLHFDLGEGDPDWKAFLERIERDPATLTADELRDALDRTWSFVRECLDRWSPADLTEVVESRAPDAVGERFARGWVVWHLMEHDLHHGGELGFLLGMHGLPAPRI